MNCDRKFLRLYAVTDRAWTGEKTLLEQVEEALKGGITMLQLREKNLSDREFLEEALAVKALCGKYHVPLIINDRVDLAIQCGADGVHVGQQDMEASRARKLLGDGMILGVSAHNVEEALKAQAQGADYLGVGAAFSTSTKSDARAISHKTIRDICGAVSIPVTAIGGINEDNILSLKGTGIDGVAVVSAVFSKKDIAAQCKKLYSLSEQLAL